MLAASSFEEYDFELVTKKILTNAIPYAPSDDGDDTHAAQFKKAFVIDTSEWYRQDNPRMHPLNVNGNPYI